MSALLLPQGTMLRAYHASDRRFLFKAEYLGLARDDQDLDVDLQGSRK